MSSGDNKAKREQVLLSDKTRGFDVYIGVVIAVLAGISAVAGTGAIYALRGMDAFRTDLGGYWMSGLPMLPQVLTGVAAAYHLKMSVIGMHIALLAFALAAGAATLGYSILAIFGPIPICTHLYAQRGCFRANMIHLYLAFFGIALGTALLGIILSAVACGQSMRRNAGKRMRREMDELRVLTQEVEAKKAETRKVVEARFAHHASPTAGKTGMTMEADPAIHLPMPTVSIHITAPDEQFPEMSTSRVDFESELSNNVSEKPVTQTGVVPQQVTSRADTAAAHEEMKERTMQKDKERKTRNEEPAITSADCQYEGEEICTTDKDSDEVIIIQHSGEQGYINPAISETELTTQL